MSTVGTPVMPAPVLLPVRFQDVLQERITADQPVDIHNLKMVFREDVFDAVARTRRGRFYRANGSQPVTWNLLKSPFTSIYAGLGSKSLITFQALRLGEEWRGVERNQKIVVLGAEPQFSIWSVSSIETDVVGEEIVTLRSRQTFGALPSLLENQIPQVLRTNLLEKYTALAEDVFRAGAESVVDRCREVMTAAISTYVQTKYDVPPGNDLADLLKILESKVSRQDGSYREVEIVLGAGQIVRQLHARGKNAEQERRPIRLIVEQDAQLAISATGSLLCDLGYARWT